MPCVSGLFFPDSPGAKTPDPSPGSATLTYPKGWGRYYPWRHQGYDEKLAATGLIRGSPQSSDL